MSNKKHILYQCFYNKAIKCSMEESCKGCEDFNPNKNILLEQLQELKPYLPDEIYYPKLKELGGKVE